MPVMTDVLLLSIDVRMPVMTDVLLLSIDVRGKWCQT